MARTRRILIVVGVLGAGLLAALPFLRTGPSPAQDTPGASTSRSGLQLASESAAPAPIDMSLVDGPQPLSDDEPAVTPPVLRAESVEDTAESPGPETVVTLPQLPDSFSASLTEPIVPDEAPVDPEQTQDASPARRPETIARRESTVHEPPRTSPPRRTWRRYLVRDGDTLESLAERLLGDAGYAEAIFQANRDRLSRRDLLPIGVELVIPDAGVVAH